MASGADKRGAARMLGFVAGSACALVLISLAIVRTLDAARIATPYVDLAAMRVMLGVLDAIAQRSPLHPETRVAFLSDSTSMHLASGARGLNDRLGSTLAGVAPADSHLRVFSFANPGFTQFTQYFLSHRLADAGPDHVVIGFNLASLAESWRTGDRPELAALLPMRFLGEALRLPTYWIGLSTDELLLYTTVAHLGVFETWLALTQQQARCVHAWGSAAEWVQAHSGAPRGLDYLTLHLYQRRQQQLLPGSPERETEWLARWRYAAALAGVGPEHPVLRVLHATLEVFRAHGIPVLVYIVPLNVEHLEALGMLDRTGLGRSIESLRQVVAASGASLLDLHDLLPDAAYSDAGGHLNVDAPLDAPPIVAQRIAQAVLAARARR